METLEQVTDNEPLVVMLGVEVLARAMQRRPTDTEVAAFVMGWRAHERLPPPPVMSAANDQPTPDLDIPPDGPENDPRF